MNILSNLKLDNSKRFVFYHSTFIGLATKEYSSIEFIKAETNKKSVKTWSESFELLVNFSNDNKRLPLASGPELEEKLYRFLYIQVKKNKRGELDLEKSNQLNDFIRNYPYKVRERILYKEANGEN